jgi:tight adherence protein C
MALLVAIFVFAGVSLAVWAYTHPAEDMVRRRILGEWLPAAPAGGQSQQSFAHRVLTPIAVQIGSTIVHLLPHNLVRTVDRMLVMANASLSTPQFLALWAVAASFGLALFVWVLRSNGKVSPSQLLLLTVAVLGPFVLGPYIVLRRKVKNRQKAITRSLPDSLDLLVTGVEAGLGVDAAFAMVTEKTGGPLAEAFTSYLRQVGLGRPRRDAFADIAERTGVMDLIRVAAAIAQAEQMGATLGDVLRVQAEDLRTLRRQRAEEAAQRAPVLMTIPMSLCFLPAMGAVVIVPSILNVMDFLHGMRGAGQ